MENWNLKRVIKDVNTKYGSPMGRNNVGKYPHCITSGNNGRIVKKNQIKVYKKSVKLIDGYDIGGSYWGIGKPLFVEFTADLSFINFYRI